MASTPTVTAIATNKTVAPPTQVRTLQRGHSSATGNDFEGASPRPDAVRAYLRSIHVPLVVWSPHKRWPEPRWGLHRDISTAMKLVTAVSDVRSILDRQAVVWVAGRHLPQAIELAPEAARVLRLAGADPSSPPKRDTASRRSEGWWGAGFLHSSPSPM